MEIEAPSYIAGLAIELLKIALQAGLKTSVFLLDMLVLESRTRWAEEEARA